MLLAVPSILEELCHSRYRLSLNGMLGPLSCHLAGFGGAFATAHRLSRDLETCRIWQNLPGGVLAEGLMRL